MHQIQSISAVVGVSLCEIVPDSDTGDVVAARGENNFLISKSSEVCGRGTSLSSRFVDYVPLVLLWDLPEVRGRPRRPLILQQLIEHEKISAVKIRRHQFETIIHAYVVNMHLTFDLDESGPGQSNRPLVWVIKKPRI